MAGRRTIVYLHVGMAKTGTTYLQNRMWANRRLLARAGLLYPGGHRGDHFKASIELRETPFAGEESTLVPGAWNAVASPARSAPDRALISHETLARATPEQIDRAMRSLSGAEVHIVVTARDLSRQIPAVWQEMVKNRNTRGYADLLAKISRDPPSAQGRFFWIGQDVADTARRWAAAIPSERVHVVTVPPPGSPKELLWNRFCAALGVDPARAEKDVVNANSSMGVVQTEFLRRLNPTLRRQLTWPDYARTIKHALVKQLAGVDDAVRLRVPAQYHPWLEDRSQEMIKAIAGDGYDVVGDLADLRPILDDSPVLMPEDVEDEHLWQTAAESIGHLAVANDRLQKRVRRVPSEPPSEPPPEPPPARRPFHPVGLVRRAGRSSAVESLRRRVKRLA